MTGLPHGIGDAFHLAAGELGMASASWLFVKQVAEIGGDEAVVSLRDALGRGFPVLDAVAAEWLEGARTPAVDPSFVLDACRGATRLVVVGLESAFLDALVPRLGDTVLVLVEQSSFDPDWARVRANLGPDALACDLAGFQRYGGRSSVLLTFGYGRREDAAYVVPEWMRVIGADVRTQFRSIVLWDVLGRTPFLYPRWLVEAPLGDFTHVAAPAGT